MQNAGGGDFVVSATSIKIKNEAKYEVIPSGPILLLKNCPFTL